MVVLETDYALVIFEEQDKLGIIQWKAKCTSEEYQHAFNALLDVQKTKALTRYISDIRKQSIISPTDRKWFENEALPRAIRQGLKAAAVVSDGNAFKKYYINVILKATNRFGLPIKMFGDLDEAKVWLMKTV